VELNRKQFALLVLGLYCAGGALLLFDYITGVGEPGAHLPLAWHVFPLSFAATVFASEAGMSGPLDPSWLVSGRDLIASYLVSIGVIATAVVWFISGQAQPHDKRNGN
jgi:hypothetical protein